MLKRRASFFYNLPINLKLMVLFAFVSIVPVFVVGIISLRIASDNMLEKGVLDSMTRLGFVDYRVSEVLYEKHKSAVLTAYDPNIRAVFEPDTSRDEDEVALIEDRAKRQLMSFFNSMEATSVMLLGQDGRAFTYSSSEYSTVRSIKLDPTPIDPNRYKIFDRWGDVTLEHGEPVIPYERVVLGEKRSEPVARLIIHIKESVFRALYERFVSSRDSEIYLVNARGVIQSCRDRSQLSGDVSLLGIELAQMTGDSGFIRVGGDMLVYLYSRQYDIYFIERTSAALVSAEFSSIWRLTVVVSLVCVLFCVLLGALFTRSVTRPLHDLIGRLGSHSPGKLPLRARRNEFALLSDQYAFLLDQLECAIANYYDEQKKKKEAQIRALEFQINPHFLYNTLSTIIWLIEAEESRAAIRITKDLSKFFRISINKGRENITIAEELTHVDLYIDIQMARYQDSIFYATDVCAELLPLYTPKLILQPLVENSIVHAMQARKEKTCTIEIRARREGEDVIFEVRDNGDTVTNETIEAMNRFLHDRESAPSGNYGIGISNVHDRIVMCFGAGYGLTFRREDGQTVASVRICVMREGAALG